MLKVTGYCLVIYKWVMLCFLLAVGCDNIYIADIDLAIGPLTMAEMLIAVIALFHLIAYLFFECEDSRRVVSSAGAIVFLGLLYLAEANFYTVLFLCIIPILIFLFLFGFMVYRRRGERERGIFKSLTLAVRLSFNIALCILVIPACLGFGTRDDGVPSFEELGALSSKMLNQQVESGYNLADETELMENIKNWRYLNIDEKGQTLAMICEIERHELGIKTPITLKVKAIDHGYLGMYSPETDEIEINISYLNRDAEECISTILHEMYHAHEFETVEALDFENPLVAESHYYRKAREWKQNLDVGYIPSIYSTENYRAQPLERDAADYAKQRLGDYLYNE